jgi:hypothetical protein
MLAAVNTAVLEKKARQFNLNGYVNKQNLHIQVTENPHACDVEIHQQMNFVTRLLKKQPQVFQRATKLLVTTVKSESEKWSSRQSHRSKINQ